MPVAEPPLKVLFSFVHAAGACSKEADREERSLETHEGLAEYTGVKLSGMSDAEQALYVIKKLQRRPEQMPTFVRSFAYLSGPAYGVLLDLTGKDWRKGLKPGDDLGERLRQAMDMTLPDVEGAAFEARAKQYAGDTLRSVETKREQDRLARVARYRASLEAGPVLVLPLHKMQFSFDPNGVQPLGESGTVYPTMRLVDDWGILTASKGALVSRTFTKAHVAAPADPKARPLNGDGWEITLNSGWTLEAGERKGDYRIAKETK
jgi:hypothetical protein